MRSRICNVIWEFETANYWLQLLSGYQRVEAQLMTDGEITEILRKITESFEEQIKMLLVDEALNRLLVRQVFAFVIAKEADAKGVAVTLEEAGLALIDKHFAPDSLSGQQLRAKAVEFYQAFTESSFDDDDFEFPSELPG